MQARHDSLIEQFLSDDNYKVTPEGKVLSRFNKQGHPTGVWRQLLDRPSKDYSRINYKGKCLAAHRIVYAALIGPLNPALVINHINGIKSDNRPENLEQVTQSENNHHRFKVLNHSPVIGFKKINQEIADEIRRQVAEENKRACDLAKEYSLAKSTISMILNNKIWKKAA